MPQSAAQTPPSVTALVLAAGFGRRFGADKRWRRLPSGSTLIEATVDRYCQVFDRVLLVLRPEDASRAATIAARRTGPGGALALVYCADAASGMGHSLAAGAAAVADDQGVVVALGDMPFVRVDTLRALKDTLTAALSSGDRHCIVQPVHAPTEPAESARPGAGHPVGFGPGHVAELRRCRGDSGARRLLQKYPQRVLRPNFDDPGLLLDVDVPEDLPAG